MSRTMERNTVSLETAKKLKAAGFPQNHLYHWVVEHPKHGAVYTRLTRPTTRAFYPDSVYITYFTAPLAQEIADELPPKRVKLFKHRDRWGAQFQKNGAETRNKEVLTEGDTMASALANLWLALKEGETHE